MNLYVFVGNRPAGSVDGRGLWEVRRTGEPRAIVISEGGVDNIQSLAVRIWFDVNEYRLWLQTVPGNLQIPDSPNRPIPRGCAYSVPNVAYVHKGNVKVAWKEGLFGDSAPDVWGAVAEWNDMAAHYRSLGYLVVKVEATKAMILSHVKNDNIAAWAIAAHGDPDVGTIVSADSGGGLDVAALELQPHHHLADVILYVCHAAKDQGWRLLISTNGRIHWTRNSVHPNLWWDDWEDLPVDVGR
jgi:hypothetical protein